MRPLSDAQAKIHRARLQFGGFLMTWAEFLQRFPEYEKLVMWGDLNKKRTPADWLTIIHGSQEA